MPVLYYDILKRYWPWNSTYWHSPASIENLSIFWVVPWSARVRLRPEIVDFNGCVSYLFRQTQLLVLKNSFKLHSGTSTTIFCTCKSYKPWFSIYSLVLTYIVVITGFTIVIFLILFVAHSHVQLLSPKCHATCTFACVCGVYCSFELQP